MGGLLIGILASLIQLGIMVGIVVLVVKAVGGRDKTSTEGVGVMIRRVFVYLIMLSMLILAAIGIGGLIDAALPETSEITGNSADAARSIAFVIVGLPVFAGLALYTARQLRSDTNEQQSIGWAFYLTVASIGSLIATMSLVGAMLSDIASGDPPGRTVVIHGVIWAGVWTAHWWVFQRFVPRNPQIHILAGSAIALVWAFTGAIASAAAVVSTIYDKAFFTSIAGGGIEHLARPAVILVVGLPVWWWYWIRHGRLAERTSMWHAYTLLLGVLGGVATAVTGAAMVLFSILTWFLGDVSEAAAAHFEVLGDAVAALVVGGFVWAYHAHVLGDREDRVRDEVDRVYDYLVASAGLVVAASGVATLIAAALKGVAGLDSVTTNSGNILPTALTLLAVGVPLWWRYWSTAQRYRRSAPGDELGSISRRIYIVGLFGIAGVVAVISLIVVVFIVVEDMLDGAIGSVTVDDIAIAFALLATAVALAWYHFAVFREDRDEMQSMERAPEEPSSDDNVRGDVIPSGSLEDAVTTAIGEGQTYVTITRVEDGYRIVSTDD